MAKTIHPLSKINPTIECWRIVVRIVRLYALPVFGEHNATNSIEMVFMDEHEIDEFPRHNLKKNNNNNNPVVSHVSRVWGGFVRRPCPYPKVEGLFPRDPGSTCTRRRSPSTHLKANNKQSHIAKSIK